MSSNRILGIAATLAGLLLYFVIVPNQTTHLSYGAMSPASFPSAASLVIATAGLALMVFPSGEIALNRWQFLRGVLMAIFAGVATLTMVYIGYLYVTPILVGSIMILLGERRPLWFATGCIVCPFATWAFFVPLLGRTLP